MSDLFTHARARMVRKALNLPLRMAVDGVECGPVEGMEGVGGSLDGTRLTVVGVASQVYAVVRRAPWLLIQRSENIVVFEGVK